MHPYETKLRYQIIQVEQKIKELRAEAEKLETRLSGVREALDLFMSDPSYAGTAEHKGQRKKRISKFSRLVEEIEKSGDAGMTTAELFDRAQELGLKIQRTSMRSQIWHYKKSGLLEDIGGRYRLTRKSEGPDDSLSSDPSSVNVH